MANYKNVVSLGCFCSPAMEFKRIERRKFSLPFDWLITLDFSLVLELIDNGFDEFLEYDNLYQVKDYPSRYRNVKYLIDFYHDFLPTKSLDKQFNTVKEKYVRRINRFYKVITEPTLFFRYIISCDELQYIYENYSEILDFFKKYNEKNNIIFLVNDDILSNFDGEIPLLYSVIKDDGDMFARRFLDKNTDLRDFIIDNVDKSTTQPQKKSSIKFMKKAYIKLMLKLGLVYHHNKQI